MKKKTVISFISKVLILFALVYLLMSLKGEDIEYLYGNF